MAAPDPDLEKVRIQNALIDAGKQGVFYAVEYDDDQKVSVKLGAGPGFAPVTVAPSDLLANEIRSEFGEPENFRRYRRRERTNWIWELRLGFDREVTLETFEASLQDRPILLPSDKTKGLTQVILALQFGNPFHPPTQTSRTGTRVTYTFQAQTRRA